MQTGGPVHLSPAGSHSGASVQVQERGMCPTGFSQVLSGARTHVGFWQVGGPGSGGGTLAEPHS